MSDSENIKNAFLRTVNVLSARPSFGHGTGRSTTRIRDGLTCESEEGPWKFVTDMPEQVGGHALGPTPGVLGRAALGSCLAMGYAMYAAKLGVLIESLQVEVQADYDDGALFGVSESPPGYLEVRYSVTVVSDATELEILRVINEGDAHSPYLDVFQRAQSCVRHVSIIKP